MKKKYESSMLQLITGILMVVAGILSFISPFGLAKVLLTIIPIVIILSGILGVVFYFVNKSNPLVPTATLFTGILNIILGVLLLFANPAVLALTIAYMLSIWFIAQAVSQIVTAFKLKTIGFSRWWLALVIGILSVILGILMLVTPALPIVWILAYVGVYLLIAGIVRLVNYFSHR